MKIHTDNKHCQVKSSLIQLKLQECCQKIQNTIANIDALRAKLVKLESDLKSGKKLTEAQADQVLRTTQQAEDFFANTEGAMTGF